MKIMVGNSNLPLARAIAAYVELPLTDASVRRFAETRVSGPAQNADVIALDQPARTAAHQHQFAFGHDHVAPALP